MVAVGKDFALQRQKGPARIDEVETGKPDDQRDLLRSHMLLDRHRKVGAALHRRVVGHDDDLAATDAADARHDAGSGAVADVHAPGSERGELEEGGSRIEHAVDTLPYRQLAA